MGKNFNAMLACVAVFVFFTKAATAQGVRVDKNLLKRGLSETVVLSIPVTGASDEILLRVPFFATHLTIESVRISKGGTASDIGLTMDSILFLKKIPNTVWLRNTKDAVRLLFASKISGNGIVMISMVLSVESKARSTGNNLWNVDVLNAGSNRRTYPIPLPKIED